MRLHLTACLALVLAACAGPGSGARPVDDASLPAASVLLGGSAGIAADPAGAAPSASTERLISADEAVSVAAPESEGTPWAKGGLAVSAIATAIDSSVRVGLAGAGIGLDLEDLLALNDSTSTVRADLFWRFSENQRHRVEVSWMDLRRSATKTLSQDVELGNGEVIAAGTTTRTKLNLDLIKAQYSYSFFQDERFDLAVGGALYVLPIDFEIEASGISDAADSFGINAPLPALGLRFDFALTPKWLLRSDLNVFYLEFDDYKGSLASWAGGVEYRPWEHVSVGAGLETFRLGVEQNGSTDVPGVREAGSIDLGYVGLGLTLKTTW